MSPVTITPVDFYSNCVALNRPCFFAGMARQWKAYNLWRYSKDGYKYLENTLKGLEMFVYKDDDPVVDAESLVGYSFNAEDKTRMEYSYYLLSMTGKAVGMTLRDSSGSMNAVLSEDVTFPEFYHDIANYLGMQIT